MSKVIYIEKNDIHATLCTWLYCGFWNMWAAEQQGHKSYINWFQGGGFLHSYDDPEMFAKEPNAYNWYFKQPMFSEVPVREETRTWETYADPSPIPFMSQPLSVIKDYYKKHLHFNESVDKRGEVLVSKYGIDFTNTIGVTYRGTDAITDGRIRLSIATYFPFIDEILEQNPKARIMCTAEEEGILDPLLARYPNAFKIEEFFSSPFQSLQNPERFSPMSGFERGLQPALMVWLFSKCAYYVKNRSSTGAVASWLSSGKIYNLAHSETLNYDKLDDQVEIEGFRYPLYR